MAVVATTVLQGQNMFVADVAWGADADTTVDVNHGLGAAPVIVIYTAMASGAITAVPMVGATVIDATKVTLAKVTVAAGSGAAAAGRLICLRPHSIIR